MRVVYEAKAMKDLKSIDAVARKAILSKIVQYAAAPDSFANNVKRLQGSAFYRLRVGDYRVIFSLDGDLTVIMTIIRVRHRREAYE